jgi:hypothetical protein
VITIEELLERKISGSGLESRDHMAPSKLVLTSPTSSSQSIGIVRSRTKAMEFSFSFFSFMKMYVGT